MDADRIQYWSIWFDRVAFVVTPLTPFTVASYENSGSRRWILLGTRDEARDFADAKTAHLQSAWDGEV